MPENQTQARRPNKKCSIRLQRKLAGFQQFVVKFHRADMHITLTLTPLPGETIKRVLLPHRGVIEDPRWR